MTLKQTLAALKKAGTAQNRKVYGRHGVTGEQFGVSFADLNRLKKAVGIDHELALALHPGDRPDAFFLEPLEAIEKEIHDRPNRVRHSMNQAVISIGVRNAALEKRARAVAKRIGKVEVDHGETSCKTPDAVAYIEKTKAHRAKKKR